jgi:dimethylhistidine N-methyltransferase
MLADSQSRLSRQFPALVIRPVVGDFLAPFRLPPIVDGMPRLGFFPGSTIGNLEPPVAIRFLRQARETLGADAMLLVGVDRRKDPSILLPAYDDAGGITAAFNRNVLLRLNREAGANFDPDAFRHLALWNDREGRIEMHLVSRRSQRVRVGDQTVSFAEGETIHTENSYKHTPEAFLALARDAGWDGIELWTDSDDLFSIHLLRAESE